MCSSGIAKGRGERKEIKKKHVAGAKRDKLQTLTGTGEDYDTAVHKLKEDLLADEPLIFLISQALTMTQREGERLDDFALRVRKAHRRIDWDTVKT